MALEGFGTPTQFDDSALLWRSRAWISVTPYLRPRHLKGGEPFGETCLMIRAECERRGWPLPKIRFDGGNIHAGDGTRSVLAFHRFRSRRGLVQPDRTGLAVRLEFPDAIVGPLALGFGCHFGLGLFRSAEEQGFPP